MSDGLTKGERRRLSRYQCAWCEQSLHRDSCGAIYEPCSAEVRAKRRADCLAGYRPRIIPDAGKDADGR